LPTPRKNMTRAYLQFDKYGQQVRHPIAVYADFESFQNSVENEKKGENTTIHGKMNGVASYCYCVVSDIPEIPSCVVIKRGMLSSS